MRVRFLYAASLTAAACAPRGGPTATPAATPAPAPPAAAPPAQPATIRLGPSALRYVAHRRIHAEQQIQGQTRTVDFGVRLFLAATISGPADTVGYPIMLTVDSIVPDSGTPIPPTANLGAVRGLTYSARIAPTGELRGAMPSDSVVAQRVAQIYGSLLTFYPRIPAGGLTFGADWTDTLTTTDRTVVEVTSTAVTRSRAGSWEERSGARCLRLEVSSTHTIAGSGFQGGQPVEVTGTGARSAVLFLAVDGRYLGGEAHDSSSITITFPVEGATVPVRQITRSTIAVLP